MLFVCEMTVLSCRRSLRGRKIETLLHLKVQGRPAGACLAHNLKIIDSISVLATKKAIRNGYLFRFRPIIRFFTPTTVKPLSLRSSLHPPLKALFWRGFCGISSAANTIKYFIFCHGSNCAKSAQK